MIVKKKKKERSSVSVLDFLALRNPRKINALMKVRDNCYTVTLRNTSMKVAN